MYSGTLESKGDLGMRCFFSLTSSMTSVDNFRIIIYSSGNVYIYTKAYLQLHTYYIYLPLP